MFELKDTQAGLTSTIFTQEYVCLLLWRMFSSVGGIIDTFGDTISAVEGHNSVQFSTVEGRCSVMWEGGYRQYLAMV